MCSECYTSKKNECPVCGAQLNDLPNRLEKKRKLIIEITDYLGVKPNVPFKIIGFEHKIVITRNGELIDHNNGHSNIGLLGRLINGELKIDNFPQNGDKCYFPTFHYDIGYSQLYWTNAQGHNFIKKAVGVYRTKEEAIAESKRRGWIDE